jgi:hypothetical protein
MTRAALFRLSLTGKLPKGKLRRISLNLASGASWTGESEVTEISVSGDGGQTWAEAQFIDPPQPFAWRRWTFDRRTPHWPGKYTLLARAKDAKGDVQPSCHDSSHGTCVINHTLPIDLFVDDSPKQSREESRMHRRRNQRSALCRFEAASNFLL